MFGKYKNISKFCSMNYLAHAVLSFDNREILAGNMISDFVKGKRQFDFPEVIQKGIRLHRAIDSFTDAHPVTKELASFFKPSYRLYSGAFADIVYDHFLANDKTVFETEGALRDFAAQTYRSLEKDLVLFPPLFQRIFPYMKSHDWLLHYRYPEGIEKSFQGLVRRASYLTESDTAFGIFNKHYTGMGDCYAEFFPQLKIFSLAQLKELLNP